MGVGIGGVNPLPAGTGGTLWYYSPQSGVRNFPKKLTFLRLNDLVYFHNFIFPKKLTFPRLNDLVNFHNFIPKKLTFPRLSIFLRFLSNFIPKKIDVFLYPPLLTSKRQVEKIFPENFQILFTLLKTIFNFAFFVL